MTLAARKTTPPGGNRGALEMSSAAVSIKRAMEANDVLTGYRDPFSR